MKWSQRQEDIFAFVSSNPTTSLIIEAVAGSGKTTTIVELASRLPSGGIFLAFNKAIATSLQSRLPATCPASTFHSLGYSILRSRIKGVKVDEKKVLNLIKASGMNEDLMYSTVSLIEKAKTFGYGLAGPLTDDDQLLYDLIEQFDIQLPEPYTEQQLVSFAKTFIAKSNAKLDVVDFGDMLYLPILLATKYNWQYDQYPYIIVDEAQDTNNVQLQLLELLTQRVIAVGDRYQAIYGFRGASYTAMDDIEKTFEASSLPLDISYRCPLSVIAKAQEYCPHIQASPTAEEGSVGYIPMSEVSPHLIGSPAEGILVVCRTNAPLIKLALARLKARKPFTCLSDIPSRLTLYVKSIKARSMKDFLTKLADRHDAKIQKFLLSNRKHSIEAENDKYEAISILASECSSVDELLSLINKLLYSKGGPTLATIHKAKGLESDTVYFYQSDKCPPPWVLDRGVREEIRQENNLIYVAITRAARNLVLVTSDE